MSVDRNEFLNSLIGLPWIANAKGPDAYDCYHLTKHVEATLFGREMAEIEVPNDPSWKFVIEQLKIHNQRSLWQETPQALGMPITAKDGSIVAMAASNHPAHIGVWLAQERRVLHTDKPDGVQFHDLLTLKALGWGRLRFYDYVVPE